MSTTSSLSALRTALHRNDISAHDVANSTTPGFSQSTPHQTSVAPEGTRLSHVSRTPPPVPSESSTSLVDETAERVGIKYTVSANAKAMTVQDRMLGTILDIIG